MFSWWLRFLRDVLIALVSAYSIYCGGLFIGLGLLISLDSLPDPPEWIIRVVPAYFATVIGIVIAISLLYVGWFICAAGKWPRRVAGTVLFILAGSLLGAWVGLLVQHFTVQHGVEDLGLYDGPGQGAVVASAICAYRSSNEIIGRIGSMMIVLSSFMLIAFIGISIEYSHVVVNLHLASRQASLLRSSSFVLSILGGVATALLLIRQASHRPRS